MMLPYRDLSETDLILRDVLAVDRTILANERTLLAYIRTALAFLITGIGLLKFFDSIAAHGLGWLFTFAGVVVLLHGARRFNKTRATLSLLQRSSRDKLDPKAIDT